MVSRSFLYVQSRTVNAFEFEKGSVSDFIARVRSELASRGLADFVTVRHDGGELVVAFRWMGSSELRYRVAERREGFSAELVGEKMSPFHTPFRQRFEDRFEQVISTVGARIS